MSGKVTALALGASGELYVGGAFNTAGNTAASGIACWNGTTWRPLGSGISGGVSALAVV